MKLNKPLILTGFFLSFLCLILPQSSVSQSTGVNLLIKINGDVKIKREKWKGFQKATVGALLSPNDLLQVGNNASATLLCSNTQKWQATSSKQFRVSEGCPRGLVSRSRNTTRSATRGDNEKIPYIISPRNTTILTNRPLLQWNKVPGATRYTVKLEGSGLDWQTETTNTEILYPGEPILQPGGYYRLVVTTEDPKVSSKDEQGANLSFNILDKAKVESINAEVAKIKQQELTPEAEKLAIAYLYETSGLKADAITILSELVAQKTQTMAGYKLLGDLYLQVGLNKQAKEAYLQSLELAEKSGDLEGQAESQFGLGEANYGLTGKDKALECLKKAQQSYLALGDESKVQEVENRIKQINK
ncbi:conserved hypothetical protein [Rippkaea orientalis PCC 8801]|uniref:Tetratricopeptide repeat protein n=1 Tax=Rippkaea orientalis (strain PCC 8801 / RF-1) TaxID=41431 RepID=B7JUS1_RIPO1|nr:tetratricopeptide repeat protein [Rippkaea orientalis]ACK65615.1 conserved hypothetical protein [Rippkaea orientalis PCC 8801]